LKKREDEVRDLKLTLNAQVAQVDQGYQRQLQEYIEQNQNLQNQLEELNLKVSEDASRRSRAEEERTDIADRYER
jgi:regulator of replication initiation timing